MKFQVRNKKRDLEILFLRDTEGWTFTKIAKKYDITKARARQLYYRVLNEKNGEKEVEVSKQMGIGV